MNYETQIDYSLRPQNQNGLVKKVKNSKLKRFKNDKILCSNCHVYKSKENYLECNLKKKHYACKDCQKEYTRIRSMNINKIVDNIYAHQKYKQKNIYSWEEFTDWLFNKTDFIDRYKNWINFDCNKEDVPSVIRIDCKKPFSLDNLKVTTSFLSKMQNVRKREKIVIQKSLDGIEIARFQNAKVASEILKINYTHIYLVCKNIRKTSGGFIWAYA